MSPITSVRRFASTYPLTVALLLLGAVLSLFTYSVLTTGVVDLTDASGQVDITYVIGTLGIEAIAAGLMLLVIWVLGWGKPTYLTTTIDRIGARWGVASIIVPSLLTILFASLVIFEGDEPDQLTIIIQLILFCITVGIFEETLFRGVVYHGLSRHLSPLWAMIASSILFGLFHMQNIMVGQDIAATMFQSLNAFALGIVFCAIMLQTNSIWWAIGLHTVWNAFLFISAYILQQQPALMDMSPEEISQSQETAQITAAAFSLPLFLFTLGLIIYSRWTKRITPRDVTT